MNGICKKVKVEIQDMFWEINGRWKIIMFFVINFIDIACEFIRINCSKKENIYPWLLNIFKFLSLTFIWMLDNKSYFITTFITGHWTSIIHVIRSLFTQSFFCHIVAMLPCVLTKRCFRSCQWRIIMNCYDACSTLYRYNSQWCLKVF